MKIDQFVIQIFDNFKYFFFQIHVKIVNLKIHSLHPLFKYRILRFVFSTLHLFYVVEEDDYNSQNTIFHSKNLKTTVCTYWQTKNIFMIQPFFFQSKLAEKMNMITVVLRKGCQLNDSTVHFLGNWLCI